MQLLSNQKPASPGELADAGQQSMVDGEKPILEYAPLGKSYLLPHFLDSIAGLPGAFGFLFVFPRPIFRLGALWGPNGVAVLWGSALVLAILTAWTKGRANTRWHWYPRIGIDLAWILVSVLPPGCFVLYLILLTALGVEWWPPQ